ncbi:formate dehydrogenase subunit gamma [Bacillus marasmi]|uniref:formate dehydrogenase subunit gamma n=1 Tax=Bacillus marasmi TaxID=1926279 RepID=UPI0011CBBFEB|nr:cytochrome b/b6 domain-containing protein [Bacillus marasmi]
MKNSKLGKIYRQSWSNRLVHWGVAVSIFSLIISGFGQMPMYKRYNIVKLPGAEWLGDYSITLVMHYLGAISLIFFVFYHMFVHFFKKEFDAIPKRGDVKESGKIIKAMITKGEEPPSDKYLAEQRLAYIAIGITVLALVITGLIKIAKNVAFIHIPHSAIFLSTTIHNAATMILIFLIISHLAAFIIKANRKLLPGMMTGYVDEEYVKHRHSKWYKQINEKNSHKST